MAAIVTPQSSTFLCDVAVHVFHGDQAIVAHYVFNDQSSGLAFIKFVRSALLQTREGGGEVRLTKEVAFVIELAAVEIDALRLRILRKVVFVSAQSARERISYPESVRSQGARRFDQLTPGQSMRTVFLQCQFHAAHCAGNTRRAIAFDRATIAFDHLSVFV